MYTDIPIDIYQIEPKRLFGLTTRQLICFACAAIVGIPTYLIFNKFIGDTLAMMLMVIMVAPFFVLILFKKNGIPAEVIFVHFLRWKWISPQISINQVTKSNISLLKQREVYTMKKGKVIKHGSSTT